MVITNAHSGAPHMLAVRTDAAGDITESHAGIAWMQERAGNYMQLHSSRRSGCFYYRATAC